MATIKTTTGGKVILKDGKPSCGCCGCPGDCPCKFYAEYISDPFGSPTVYYFEMTGYAVDWIEVPPFGYGLYTGEGPNGTVSLIWHTQWDPSPPAGWVTFWKVVDPAFGDAYAVDTAGNLCGGSNSYYDETDQYHIAISETPLP